MMTENNVTDESISSASFENHFERNEPNNNNNLGPLDILAKTVLGEEIQSDPIPAGFVQTTEPLSKSGVTIQEGLEFCDAMGSMIEDLSKQPCQLISAQNNISPLKADQLLMSLQEIILAEHNYNKPYSLINEKVGKSRRSTSNNNPNVTKKPRKIKEKHKEKAEKKPKAPKVVKEVIDKPPVINNNNATNKVIKIKKRTKNQSFELLKSPLATQSSPVKSNVAEIDEPLIYRQEEGVGETTGADANNNNNNPLSLIPNNLHDDVEKAKFKPEILPPMSSISNNQTESQQSPESENTKEEIKTEPEFKNEEQFEAPISKPADSKVDCKEEEEVDDAKSETDIKSDIIKSEESSVSLISSEETTSGSSKMQEIQTQAQLTTPQSGRSQRVRKKPKRWTDDEVEVDFSGQLNILGAENPTVQEQTSAETNANLAPVVEETTPVVAKKTRRGNQSKLSESNGSYPVAMKELPTPPNVLVNDEESSLSDAEDQEEQDEAQDDDSSFSSDDDPEKLWCICRQPYDDRFMISCDSCEEWFHGKCVNVTKVQGRKMERLKQEWFCKTCIEGLKNGTTREELKREAEIKAAEIEAAEREQFASKKAAKKLAQKKVKESPKKKVTKAATKKAAAVKKEVQSPPVTHQPPVIAIKSVRRSSLEVKEEPKKSEPVSPIKEVVPVVAKKEEIYSSESDDDSIKSEDDCDEEMEVSNKAHNKSSEATTKATKAAAAKENQRKESMKELEDKRRLKKLIKASKKDFIEKQEKLQKIKLEQRNTSSDTAVDFAEPHDSAVNSALTTPTTPNSINFVISPDDFSKVVTIKKSDKDVPKKKHKSQPIDRSVQDLFKAEPVLVRSLSTSSTLSPVAAAPVFQRKEFRRTSISSSSSSSHDQDIYCPAGCGKINYSPKSNFYNNSTNQEETSHSIYCNQSCIQLHVTEMIKFLRAAKRLKERANPHLPPKPLKGVVVNRITGKILSGKDALLEKDLLDFLIKNPSYEIYKPIGFSRPPKSLQLSSSSKSNQANSNHSHNSHNNNHHHHSNSKSSTPTTPTKSSFNSNNNHKSSSDSKKSSSKSATNSSDSSKKHHEKSSSSSSSNDSSKKSHDKSSTSTSHGSPVKIERTSSTSEKPDDHNRRKFVRNALKDIFNTRYKEMSSSDKSRISLDDIPKLSLKIEDELFKLFKCINPKYNVKSRSLIFNLKDPKNSLYRKVLLGKIPPGRLVNMSAEELASSELARWRENEKKTMIELIKRDAVDQANQVIVKKTHKGEEIIQESHDLISDLPIADSQIETLISSTSTKDVQSASCSSTNETNLSHNSQETSVTNESIVNALMLDFNANDSSVPNDLLDTTSQHKSHVFSNNCKICTRTLAEDVKNHEMSKESLSSTTSALLSSTSSPPSTSATSSLSTVSSNSIVAVKSKSSKDDKNRSQPKRVRIEPESTNKFLEKVVKMSDTLLKSSVQLPLLASTSDSSNSGCASESSPLTPTTTRDVPSLEMNVDTSKQESGANHPASSPAATTAVKSIWKGTIFMQDVAKFVADAYNLSGTIALDLSQDMSDHITVCGRITPEQVLDYVAKLKITKRTDIGVVKFLWSSREERIGYDAFFNYLNSRGRYGVVGNVGKNYKDFYILPLSRSSDIPKVLLPVDSSAIESKIHRPNLLLGILIRTKKLPTSQVLQPTNIPLTSVVSSSQQSTISSTTPTQSHLEQSYTPPPPEDDDDDDGSYTPPQNPPSSKRYSEDALAFIHDSDSKIPKYDPEEPLVLRKSSATASVSPSYINDLMEKVATSSNPVDMTQSVLTAISNSDNLNLKKRLLEQLTEKVEDQRRQLEKQKRETEEKIISSSVSVLPPGLPLSGGGHHLASPLTSAPPQSSIANLASSSVSLDNVFNNIKNIQIPDNLKDILQTVQEKTAQIEAQQARLRSINTDFIASNSTSSADPRLRSKKPITLSSTEPTEPVASMSQDELLRKAQEQMAALAQMESHCDDSNTNCNNKTNNKGPVFVVGVPPNSSSSGFRGHNSHSDSSPRSMNSPTSCTSSGSVPSMPKISFSWKKKK